MREYALTYPQLMNQAEAAGWDVEALAALRRAYELSAAMCDGLYRASSVPFLCHLVRTASIVLAQGLPPPAVQAALLHAVYRLHRFGGSRRRRARRRRRVQLRRVAGAEVEALVCAYQQHRWYVPEAVEDHLRRLADYDANACTALRIRLADELEDALDRGLGYQGPRVVESRLAASGAPCIRLAERLGMPELAKELAEAFERLRERPVPEELALSRSESYEAPRHHLWERTPPEQLAWRAGSRLRRIARRARVRAGARPRLVVLGGDADGNLGDRAILLATVEAARAEREGLEVTLVSAEPGRWREVPGTRVVPRGVRGLPRLCSALVRADLVLCGGGGLFQDDDSLVKMPYWALRVALARVLCRRVVGYSLGVGPLRAASSRLSARLAFACLDEVTVRDPEALRVAAALTSRRVRVVPDPALLLADAPAGTARAWLAARGVPLDGRPLVGFTTRRWSPPRARLLPHRVRSRLPRPPAAPPEAERLPELLAAVLDALAERHDAHVLMLPTYNLPHEGDDRVCERVLACMRPGSGQILRIDDPLLYRGVTGKLRVMLTGRMHPAIFAASAGTPVVGLAYNPKFHGLFELLGRRDRVMEVESFVAAERVPELLEQLEAAFREGSAPREREALRERVEALREEVRRFHGELAGRAA